MQDCVQEYYDTNENEQITQEDFKKKINISKGMGYIDDYNYMLAVSYQIAAVAGCFRDYMLMAPVSKGSYSASNNNLIDVSTTSKLDVAAVASATTKIRNNGAGMLLWVSATYADSKSDLPLWIGNFDTPYGNLEIKLIPSASPLMTIKEEAGKAAAYLVSKDAVAVRYNRKLFFEVFDEGGEDRYSIVGSATAESAIVNKKGIIKILFKTS